MSTFTVRRRGYALGAEITGVDATKPLSEQDVAAIRKASNDNIVAFAKLTPPRDNCVMVLVNLDPHNAQECTYEVPLWEFGLPDHASIGAEDLLLGISFTLHGKTHHIRLDPYERSVVVWRLLGRAPSEVRP